MLKVLAGLHATIQRLCEGKDFEATDRSALEAAAGELELYRAETCSYIVNSGREVLEGQRMQLGSRLCIFQFRQLAPIHPDQAGHYEHPRWCLVDPPGIENRCDRCSGREPSA